MMTLKYLKEITFIFVSLEEAIGHSGNWKGMGHHFNILWQGFFSSHMEEIRGVTRR
jgi:hypothetical protein